MPVTFFRVLVLMVVLNGIFALQGPMHVPTVMAAVDSCVYRRLMEDGPVLVQLTWMRKNATKLPSLNKCKCCCDIPSVILNNSNIPWLPLPYTQSCLVLE